MCCTVARRDETSWCWAITVAWSCRRVCRPHHKASSYTVALSISLVCLRSIRVGIGVNYLLALADEMSASYLHVGRRRIITELASKRPTTVVPSPDALWRRPLKWLMIVAASISLDFSISRLCLNFVKWQRCRFTSASWVANPLKKNSTTERMRYH